MKRFKFSLEKALELRQYREQEAKNELGRAISILTNIENNIKQNALTHSQAVQQRFMGMNVAGDTAVVNDSAGAISMFTWDNYISRLEQEAQRLMEEAAKAEIVVEEKRELYMEASRELKVMENLKEKREKEYRKEAFAAEAHELDDMYRPER
jgi:flagellar FliJ protein